MKRIIVEEYDSKGKLVKKTITEENGYTPYWPYWSVCICGTSAPCPFHPVTTTITPTVTYSSITSANLEELNLKEFVN